MNIVSDFVLNQWHHVRMFKKVSAFSAQIMASFLGFAGVANFIARVYPGNIYMAYDWRDREISQQLVAYLRLPFQIPLIWWAVSIAKNTTRK